LGGGEKKRPRGKGRFLKRKKVAKKGNRSSGGGPRPITRKKKMLGKQGKKGASAFPGTLGGEWTLKRVPTKNPTRQAGGTEYSKKQGGLTDLLTVSGSIGGGGDRVKFGNGKKKKATTGKKKGEK